MTKKLLFAILFAAISLCAAGTAHAQAGQFTGIRSEAEPLGSCTSGTATAAEPIVFDTTTGRFMVCHSNAWVDPSILAALGETDGDIVYGLSGAWSKGTALPNGITATTQSAADNSTKVATTAYVDTAAKRYRVCDIAFGDESASVLTNAQLGPQKRICFVPEAATIVEMDVAADGGTPSIIIGLNHAGTVSNIVSAALATAASGGIACSKTTAVAGIDGVTTCSATLQNTSITAGDYIEAVSGTAGGTAKLLTVHVVYEVN